MLSRAVADTAATGRVRVQDGATESAARGARVRAGLRRGRAWFRAFRRTRPFWGGVWMVAGGWTVLKFSLAPMQLVVSTGFDGIAGYLLGGGMILSGLVPLAAPQQRYTFGIIGAVLAVVSLVASNLGGFLLGMVLGVLGGSMMAGWGPKRPARGKRRPAAGSGTDSGAGSREAA
ncbi:MULTISPECIES: DUF6114 domain-containing protein [Streptomyces]|uniref:Uncharacterized protein n=2 Tax=Streptomyces TaxID=1883 RepID=A0ACC7Y587_9ACTN|nr:MULTISPECIES: DUF6114 domain-containing protein [Streptomyces]NUV76801.1 hypothetical protein [Streptomyces fungicidicus]PAX91658.1 hypothetical protein CLM82_07975 [Streptomyces albidoflavus]PBO16238.1 hypothetical protein CLM83_25065 [Streptomyces albidoflavus]PBO26142.1 hypothetical protein CLM85_00630 [Streptomyces albidoflavus]PBO30997.1 hypothetical protein CLM84_05155 [Streptomyces albidoflavus]